jgi:hypothetical protein
MRETIHAGNGKITRESYLRNEHIILGTYKIKNDTFEIIYKVLEMVWEKGDPLLTKTLLICTMKLDFTNTIIMRVHHVPTSHD